MAERSSFVFFGSDEGAASTAAANCAAELSAGGDGWGDETIDGSAATADEAVELIRRAISGLQMMNMFGLNTTIAAIVTNADLNKAEMNKVAEMASNGMARTIRPINTSMDGDSVYALCTGKVKSSADVVGTLAAHVLAKAINRAVTETTEMYGYKSAQCFM